MVFYLLLQVQRLGLGSQSQQHKGKEQPNRSRDPGRLHSHSLGTTNESESVAFFQSQFQSQLMHSPTCFLSPSDVEHGCVVLTKHYMHNS